MKNFYQISIDDIDGNPACLSQYEGKVVLVVNVASRCGLTPQYAALEKIYNERKAKGFIVLGAPCNQFGGQEPWPEEQIKSFCHTEYDVSFPMTQKIDVNGDKRHPLYQFLAGVNSPFPGDIKWNFEKFLVNRKGDIVKRFEATLEPLARDIVKNIEEIL